MFVLDSLVVSGLRWVLNTVAAAADAEMTDDSVLREQLLSAELRREMGEISDEEFAALEADLLARIRQIRERREGGTGPIAFGRSDAAPDAEFAIEATVSGDFHEPEAAPTPLAAAPPAAGEASGTIIDGTLAEPVTHLPLARRRRRPRAAARRIRRAAPSRRIRRS